MTVSPSVDAHAFEAKLLPVSAALDGPPETAIDAARTIATSAVDDDVKGFVVELLDRVQLVEKCGHDATTCSTSWTVCILRFKDAAYNGATRADFVGFRSAQNTVLSLLNALVMVFDPNVCFPMMFLTVPLLHRRKMLCFLVDEYADDLKNVLDVLGGPLTIPIDLCRRLSSFVHAADAGTNISFNIPVVGSKRFNIKCAELEERMLYTNTNYKKYTKQWQKQVESFTKSDNSQTTAALTELLEPIQLLTPESAEKFADKCDDGLLYVVCAMQSLKSIHDAEAQGFLPCMSKVEEDDTNRAGHRELMKGIQWARIAHKAYKQVSGCFFLVFFWTF